MPPKRKVAVEKKQEEILDNLDENVAAGGDAILPTKRAKGTRGKKVTKAEPKEDDEIIDTVQKKGVKKGRVNKTKPEKVEEESDSPSETASEEPKEKPKKGSRAKKISKPQSKEDVEVTDTTQKKGAMKRGANKIKPEQNEEDAESPSETAPEEPQEKPNKVSRAKKIKPEQNEDDSESPSETAPEELQEKPKKASRAKKTKLEHNDEDSESPSENVPEEPKEKPKKASRAKKTKLEHNDEDSESPSENVSDEPKEKPKKVSRAKKNKPEQIEEDLDSPSETATEEPKEKPKKVSRAKKPKSEEAQAGDEEELLKKKPARRDRTKAAKEDIDVPKKKNATSSNWEIIDFTCNKKNEEGNTFNLKISSWNIGGLKSWIKKECLQFMEHEDPDIFCLQETKCNETNLPEEMKDLKGYKQYWCSSEKLGYAGVGLLTKVEPLEVIYGIGDEDMDADGRCITAEYENYYVVCLYVPNAGRGLVTLPKRLIWNDLFKEFINNLNEKKPVIICGDMNVSHKEIDLARPKSNTKNAGFTPEERDGMTNFLAEGYVDSFRALYPDREDAYTFWTYMSNARSKNVGWRLDYFIVSDRLMKKICDNVIRSEIAGSDHCPITLFLNI